MEVELDGLVLGLFYEEMKEDLNCSLHLTNEITIGL